MCSLLNFSNISRVSFPGLLGFIFLLCAFSLLFLPETHREPLLATIEELEDKNDDDDDATNLCCGCYVTKADGDKNVVRVEMKQVKDKEITNL